MNPWVVAGGLVIVGGGIYLLMSRPTPDDMVPNPMPQPNTGGQQTNEVVTGITGAITAIGQATQGITQLLRENNQRDAQRNAGKNTLKGA